MSNTVPKVKLNDGTSIPVIGFGTGTALFKKECADMVLAALESGYDYLDTAQQYDNATSVGDALKRWGGKREDVHIVTKFGRDKAPAAEIEPRRVLLEQLKMMGLEYVDLYLIHNPFYAAPLGFAGTWKVMEQLKAEGLTKSIGVSNFREEDLQEMADSWSVPPAVNQIEYNPYIYHAPNMLRLAAFCKSHDIKLECYGPLNSLFRSTGGPVDPVVDKIAKAKGATQAQVLLAWARQYSGGIVVTTSRDKGRQAEQLKSSTLSLSEGEVEEIAEAGKGRFYRHFQRGVWDAAKP